MTYLKAPPLTLRLGLATLALAVLVGCGFHPMYGPSLSPSLSSIYVEPIAERDGYELRNSLIFTVMVGLITTAQAYWLTWMIP